MNLTGDSFLSSDTWGQGNAGNITINGEGATILIQGGENSDSQISTSNNATGNAGDINIKARRLSLEDGGFLRSNTLGQGNAGNITIDVDENISLANGSYIGSAVSQDAVGQGGQINLTAKSVSLSEISLISTATLSDNEQSNGGNIEVNVSESLNITTNSFLSSITDGKSNAGNITINGDEATILVQGRGNIGDGANISNSSGDKTTGNAGDIKITGRSLALKDGGTLSSFTLGQGLPGNIMIDIEENLTLINNGGISSFVGDKAVVPEAEKSTIQINAGSLSIAENSSITTFSEGIGIAGDVVIDVDDAFDFVGGLITSELRIGAEGKAGNIDINAHSLSLKDGAFFDSSTSGQGDSGKISITTDEAVTLSGAGTSISNTVNRGAIGNSQGISIEAESLSITDGAQIQTLVRGASENNPAGIGNAGSININTDNAVNIVGGSIRSSLGTDAEGSAGDIKIEARSLSLEDGAVVNSSTFGQGDSGRISITTDEAITLSITGTRIRSIVGTNAAGKAGDITIQGRSLSLDNGASLNTSTFGNGNSGIVSLKTDESITLSGAGTTIFNNVERGGVGNSQGISIEAESLSIIDGAQIQTLVRRASEANPAGVGNGGTINIKVRDGVNLSGIGVNSEGITVSSLISSALGTGAEGKAGDINITARKLSLENGARLSTSSGGQGDAGNINLDIQETFNLSGFAFNSDETIIFSTSVRSVLEAGAEGKAGDINLKARSLSLENGAILNNSSFGVGDAGNITLDIQDAVNLSGFSPNSNRTGILSSQITSLLGTNAIGTAGNINIKARTLSLDNGGSLNNSSSGIGNAGDITLDIQDTVNISGFALNSDGTSAFSSQVRSRLETGANGKAGNIHIKARTLSLEDRGQINNNTFGIGNAGNIDINVDDSINLFRSSFITNSVGQGGVGNGGNLDIEARSLTLTEGSQITTVVFRAGVNTPGGEGKGGDIRITATDFVDISGVGSVQLNIPDTSNDPSNTTGLIPTAGFSSGLFAINNSRSFDLEPSFSWIRDEFPVSQNFLSQQLFNNVNAGLSSKGAFSETYNNQISNYAYDASLETAQAVYLGYFQGTLEANSFTYTAGNGNSLAVISGNGNINYGSGYYDSINFSQISVNQVVDYSFAEIGSGGEIFNPGDGDRVFDYITLDNGTTILFEGIDKIYFSEGEIDLTVNPNDTGYLDQWNLHMMGVQNAWRFTTGSDDVLIGVQDSGLGVFNGNFHPDLNNTLYYADNVADEFYREVPGDSYRRYSSHGTAVQGIIGAATDNGRGIAGINWNSNVFHIDLDIDQNVGDLDIVDATQRMINYANSQDQRLVINMSFGGGSIDPAFEQLVANNQDNALFVIATGNDGRNGISNPSSLAKSYDNVIAVGASWGFESEYTGGSVAAGTRADYSNYGEGITLMGPTAVPSTRAYHYSSFFSGFSYDDDFNGTSAATPNVAGVASLVWSANSDLSATAIKNILSDTAYDLGSEGYDLVYGHGFVNADAAVRRAMALSSTDSLTGISSNNSFSTANASTYDSSEADIDPLTGKNYSNQFALEEDSLLLTQQISDDSFLELSENTTINLGAANSNEMMTVLKDSFSEDFGYDSPFAMSNSLGEGNVFYNDIEV